MFQLLLSIYNNDNNNNVKYFSHSSKLNVTISEMKNIFFTIGIIKCNDVYLMHV